MPRAAARAVVGKSSGGYGALVMGAHHPDVFGHVASHAGDAGFEYCYLPDFPRAAAALQGRTPTPPPGSRGSCYAPGRRSRAQTTTRC